MLKQIYFFTFIVLLSFSISNAQPLTKIWQHYFDANNYPSGISYLGVIDHGENGDFLLENGKDSIFIMDWTLQNIKYNLSNKNLNINGGGFSLSYNNYDFNGDGHVDFWVGLSDGGRGIYDLYNDKLIFELHPSQSNGGVFVEEIADVNNDGKLDVLFDDHGSGSGPYYDIYYLYSSNVSVTSAVKTDNSIPQKFLLNQNYSNPFNPSTTIGYNISQSGEVNITIYDIQGRIVKDVNEMQNIPGSYKYIWNGRNNFGSQVASGPYFYQVRYGNVVQTKKMILLK